MTPQTRARLERSRKIALYLAAALALLLFSLDRLAALQRPAADSKAVVIYTTTWCPYCARLRADLAASGVPYVEHDVERSLRGVLGFWGLRARGVPVSAIGPAVVYGYDVVRLHGALRALGYTYVPGRPAGTDAPPGAAASSSIGNAR